jgi:hypothetical protein
MGTDPTRQKTDGGGHQTSTSRQETKDTRQTGKQIQIVTINRQKAKGDQDSQLDSTRKTQLGIQKIEI